jgi:hypothetical protein
MLVKLETWEAHYRTKVLLSLLMHVTHRWISDSKQRGECLVLVGDCQLLNKETLGLSGWFLRGFSHSLSNTGRLGLLYDRFLADPFPFSVRYSFYHWRQCSLIRPSDVFVFRATIKKKEKSHSAKCSVEVVLTTRLIYVWEIYCWNLRYPLKMGQFSQDVGIELPLYAG